jgi:hypothetical protein
MPSRYRRDVARLKADIVRRAAAGESVRAIGADPALPGPSTIRGWARADAAFAAQLAAARAEAAARGVYVFDEGVAAAFLAAARAGARVRSLLGRPGMPSARAYRYWCATQGEFAAAVAELRRRRNAAIERHGRARWRPFDPVLADRIIVRLHAGARLDAVLAADPALPSRPTLRRWRRQQPEFDRVLRMIAAAWRRRRAAARSFTPAFGEAVIARIIEGASFNSLSREAGMPSRGTLRRWMAARPDFAEDVARACVDREHWYNDQILMLGDGATPAGANAARRRIGALKRQLVRLRNRPGRTRG